MRINPRGTWGSSRPPLLPQPPLPILRSTSRQSWAQKDSSQPRIRGWENKLCFQLWHVGPCSCQSSKSAGGWVGWQLQVLLQRQTKPCVLSVTGWIPVNYSSGLVYIVYGVTSQNDIWCTSPDRAEERREICREKIGRALVNSYFCHWVFAPGRNRKAKRSIYRVRYG